ncbi:hypothetical protein BJ165DRAFT_151005 [Panaeolus papilionaceus]|nr:hypothetical protein BJ165DRAFT_151005 [Panaeolus papilionaceus]
MHGSTALITPSTIAKKVVLSTFHGLAFITTTLRLFHRYRVRRLWWDDFWALCALLCAIVTYSVFWIRLINGHRKALTLAIMIAAYVAGLWCARISVAVTLVRLLNKGRFKTVSKIVTVALSISGGVLVLLRILNCDTRFDRPPYCKTPRTVVYLELILDLLSDAWLVAAPLVMLYRTNLSAKHRQIITWVFSCGILTTATSILHIFCLITRQDNLVVVTSHVQLGVAIAVCNLLVLVTYVYRKIQPREETHTLAPPRILTIHTRPNSTPPTPLTSMPESVSRATETRDFDLTELGSSMLGGSSRDMDTFALHTINTNTPPETSNNFKSSARTASSTRGSLH